MAAKRRKHSEEFKRVVFLSLEQAPYLVFMVLAIMSDLSTPYSSSLGNIISNDLRVFCKYYSLILFIDSIYHVAVA